MKVSSMRLIDRYVGIPLCFLLDIFLSLGRIFCGIEKGKPDLRRTLFIELSEMGSTVLADPAMRKLQADGEAELFFVIFKHNDMTLRAMNTIPPGNCFAMRAGNFLQLTVDVFRFMYWCRRKRMTTVIDLELFSRFTALLTLLTGCRHRIGFYALHEEGFYRGNLINRPVRYNPHVHISINYMALVYKALGYYNKVYPTFDIPREDIILHKSQIPEATIGRVTDNLRIRYPAWEQKRLILFNVNASDTLPQRRWMPEYFVEVGKQLLSYFPDILILCTGTQGEHAYVDSVVKQVGNKRCINLSGQFDFEALMALFTLSRLLLTNDSGPAHFAALTDIKSYVIFGPETPALYLPLGNTEAFYLALACSPCVSAANHRKTSCTNRQCLNELKPETVLKRMMEWLMENGGITN